MLSELRAFGVVDSSGGRAHLLDLAVDLGAGDHPPATALICGRRGEQRRQLPWSAVTRVDALERRLVVPDLSAGTPAPADGLADAVLLRRDVMDAQIVDLAGLRTTRANDLWLASDGAALVLSAVDVGAWAILRRLGRGWLGRGDDRDLLDWANVEFLRGDAAAARAGRHYHRRIARLPPGEIAHLAEALPYPHAAELVTLLPDQLAADTLEVTSPTRQLQVYEELDEPRAVRLLPLMAPDVAADLLGRMLPDEARRYLEQLPPERAERLIDLLRYPDDSAGGIMTNDLVLARGGMTIGEARRTLRDRFREPDFINFVYVVGDEESRSLLGVLSVRDLIVADDGDWLEDLMRRDLVTVAPLEPALAAAQRVADSHLAALPVVGGDGRLLGAVTIDGALGVLAPRAGGGHAPRVFS